VCARLSGTRNLKTLVLGIGNTLLGDDGAGVRVVRQVAEKTTDPQVCFRDTSAAGLNLLDIIPGYDRLIVVDAILTDDANIGRVFCFDPGPSQESSAISLHSCALDAALKLACSLDGTCVPSDVKIIAIGIKAVENVTETLTPSVEAALDKAAAIVTAEIRRQPCPTTVI
jgi:hydrogenase maturation protease